MNLVKLRLFAFDWLKPLTYDWLHIEEFDSVLDSAHTLNSTFLHIFANGRTEHGNRYIKFLIKKIKLQQIRVQSKDQNGLGALRMCIVAAIVLQFISL